MTKEFNKEPLNILLIYPRYPDTFWSFRHALKFISKKSFIPPLGLLTVASLLPSNWNQRLVDLNVDVLLDEDILWADYVLISAMEIQKKSVREIVSKAKDFGKRIVAGGPLFSLSPDRFEEIDHLILQEAETNLPSFIKDLKKGEAKHLYANSEWPDLTLSPLPKWDLIDFSNYAVMSVQYCRGCPFDCEFCDVALLNGKEARIKTEIQILEELDTLYMKGWRGIVFFADDNFILKPRKLKGELLPALTKWMEERRYPFSFLTQASINLGEDEDLMKLMVAAGFNSVFVGIETVEEKSLVECRKVMNSQRDMMAAVKKMQNLGLQVLGGFIVGFDNDPPRIFEDQVNFIQQSGIVTAMVGLLNAPPGTKLYKRLQREGRLLGEPTGDNMDASINFIPKLDYHQLVQGYKYILSSIYSPRHFYHRIVVFLANYTPPKKGRETFKLCYVKAFFQSIWTLGIIGKGRFYYWKTLLWTACRYPAHVPLCVRLSIYGHHFQKIYENSGRQGRGAAK